MYLQATTPEYWKHEEVFFMSQCASSYCPVHAVNVDI